MMLDLPYRIALVAIAALQFAILRGYLGKARAGTSLRQPRAEGRWLAAGTAAFFLMYGAAVLVYLIDPAWMAWSRVALPGALRWCGAPLMAVGAALHLWGTHHLGANLSITISTGAGHRLVTSGPYRRVRHPLYTGGMIESLGVCLLLADAAVTAGAAGFWVLVALRTAREEAILLETFGEAYRRYQGRVGRFLPRVSNGQGN